MRASYLSLALLWACESASVTPELPPLRPAHVDHPVAESELAIVRLEPETVRRLALATAAVEETRVPAVRLTGGEVIVPPGLTMTVSAPVGGELRLAATERTLAPGTTVKRGDPLLRLVPFAPVDRDVRARAEREVAASAAQLQAAEARVTRLSQAGAERAISRRAYEDAVAARDIVRADVAAAAARARTTRTAPLLSDAVLTVRAPGDGVVRTLSVGPGQAVAAGAALLEIVAVDALQVRVAIYAGDLRRVDAQAPARVRTLSADDEQTVSASPLEGPPTAAPERATLDRYYALPGGAGFVPGERVLVELPLRSEQRARTVPRASVVYDALGAAWIYTCVGERAFRRARIDPVRGAGDRLVFVRGPALGTCVASVGAAELFGSEFEPGH